MATGWNDTVVNLVICASSGSGKMQTSRGRWSNKATGRASQRVERLKKKKKKKKKKEKQEEKKEKKTLVPLMPWIWSRL